mmetsp:Transcript_10125/g.30527  ORF Transcript_10125/g.30527 Transcript_10125/m.30527 type:complete len:200 (+) Transcript_10125:7436-8035(+)
MVARLSRCCATSTDAAASRAALYCISSACSDCRAARSCVVTRSISAFSARVVLSEAPASCCTSRNCCTRALSFSTAAASSSSRRCTSSASRFRAAASRSSPILDSVSLIWILCCSCRAPRTACCVSASSALACASAASSASRALAMSVMPCRTRAASTRWALRSASNRVRSASNAARSNRSAFVASSVATSSSLARSAS